MSEYTDHHAPTGLRTRGTVVVVPGRGETRATYARFGRRLAADAYRVRVLDAPATGTAGPGAAWAARLGADVDAAVAGTAGQDGVARPVVLVGADTGAAALAALLDGAAPGPRADAAVLAGLPGRRAAPGGTWEEELDVRTSCPTHRGALSDDARVRRGALAEPVDGALLAAAYGARLVVPTLLLVGGADPLADRDALADTAKSLARARLSVVPEAHHDVLNDLQHRSVAAEVVGFLEALRGGLVPAVRVESSAW
ncbi:alpha/beta hydrolase [Streptomyces sp. NPDC050560]|uniref:alpha/beta hydrolase n=1 Tax=Streptomyces sp. NPDC050560 TaxID=3365630 RepID=UPI00378A685E